MKQSQKLRLTVFSFIFLVSGCSGAIVCRPTIGLISGASISSDIPKDIESLQPGIKCNY